MSRPDGRRWLRTAAVGVILAAAAVGCSDGDGTVGEDPQARDADPAPAASSPIRRLRPGEPCPVTAPVAADDLPPVLAAEADSPWYGEDELWVSLPREQAVTSARVNGRYSIKFATVTLRDGQLTSFSDSGCWTAASTLRDTTIRFVLRIA